MPWIRDTIGRLVLISEQRGPGTMALYDEDIEAASFDAAATADLMAADLAEVRQAAFEQGKAEGLAAGKAAGRKRVQDVAAAVLKAGGSGDQIVTAMELAIEAAEMPVDRIAAFVTKPTLASMGFPGLPPGASARLADREKLPNSLDRLMAELHSESKPQ